MEPKSNSKGGNSKFDRGEIYIFHHQIYSGQEPFDYLRAFDSFVMDVFIIEQPSRDTIFDFSRSRLFIYTYFRVFPVSTRAKTSPYLILMSVFDLKTRRSLRKITFDFGRRFSDADLFILPRFQLKEVHTRHVFEMEMSREKSTSLRSGNYKMKTCKLLCTSARLFFRFLMIFVCSYGLFQ